MENCFFFLSFASFVEMWICSLIGGTRTKGGEQVETAEWTWNWYRWWRTPSRWCGCQVQFEIHSHVWNQIVKSFWGLDSPWICIIVWFKNELWCNCSQYDSHTIWCLRCARNGQWNITISNESNFHTHTQTLACVTKVGLSSRGKITTERINLYPTDSIWYIIYKNDVEYIGKVCFGNCRFC